MKYPFKVFQTQVETHVFWAAESLALKGCVAQGDTITEALSELEENEEEWLKTAKEFEIEIPPIPIEQINTYSGKFTVRVAPYVHQEAAKNAQKQNISLNQYINDAIVSQNSRMSTVQYVAHEITTAINTFKYLLFNSPSTISGGSTQITISNTHDSSPYKVDRNKMVQTH